MFICGSLSKAPTKGDKGDSQPSSHQNAVQPVLHFAAVSLVPHSKCSYDGAHSTVQIILLNADKIMLIIVRSIVTVCPYEL